MYTPKILPRAVVVPVFILVVFSCSAIPLFSQETKIDYNDYYRFPFSIGIEYQSLSPFGDYGGTFNIYEVAGQVRWPIPKHPVLQPTARFGMMQFDSQDALDPEEWDHRNYFITAGILFTSRISKNFEIGVEALAGYAQAVFPNLIPEEDSVGSSNLLFEAGARIALNPSYNFSIDFHPNLKYLHALSDLDDFNGLILGLGISAHYRFGQDPDSASSLIRSVRFEEASIEPLFSAMQSYYAKYPIGSVSLTNIEKHPITDVNVAFYQASFMDSPTPAGNVARLSPGETMEVDLYATLNQEVFKTEGVTPLTGEIIVSYNTKGKAVEQRQPVSYDLHDKTAIVWNDDRKVAAYITPADSALRNYASFIRQTCKDTAVPAYNEQVQIALQIYQALGEIGILYQADPASPFASVQDNPMVVDSISLPRDTLKRITGDCDDLTVLYNSLLETVGIETGYITMPGHIYAAFNTKTQGRSFNDLHPERELTINVDGELWIPVEITMIGSSGFLGAWRKGAEQWNMFHDAPEMRRFYSTRTSQELYRPVGLKETDLGLQYGEPVNIVRASTDEMKELVNLIVQDYILVSEKSGKKEDFNRLGIAYAKFTRYPSAEGALRKALQIDPRYASALANLGNVAYLQGDYRRALIQFNTAYDVLQDRGKGDSKLAQKVLLNISRAHYEMKQYDKAKDYFETAYAIDPAAAEHYAYIAQVASGEARASEMADNGLHIIFIEEDE